MGNTSEEVFLVCASKESETLFSRSTLLGRSLSNFPGSIRPKLLLYPNNKGEKALGLPQIYNSAIRNLPKDSIAAFIHDDIYLHDWNFCANLRLGLSKFDIVGLVGCLKAESDQPGWCFRLDGKSLPKKIDVESSGSVNHFDPYRINPCYFGESGQSCELLDGALLAVKTATIIDNQLHFDERFRFHCYDTDFCRDAILKNLSLGTWPIPCTHGSPGSFSEDWVEAAKLWVDKWTL